MDFVLDNKTVIVNKTRVDVRCDRPFTFYTRELEGDRTAETDESLINAVLELVQIELDPSGALSKIQDAVKETRENVEKTEKNAKISSDALIELTTTVYDNASALEEINARLDALEGKKSEKEDEHEEVVEQPSGESTGEAGGAAHD